MMEQVFLGIAETHKKVKSANKCKLINGFICLSDWINPGELLLSRARFRFIQFVKCKWYTGLKKMCKLVTGLLTKKCKLFS